MLGENTIVFGDDTIVFDQDTFVHGQDTLLRTQDTCVSAQDTFVPGRASGLRQPHRHITCRYGPDLSRMAMVTPLRGGVRPSF